MPLRVWRHDVGSAAPVSWPGVERVGVKAGSCLLFSEKLKHATLPWNGRAAERRTVFYKYVPYGCHHDDFGYDLSDPGLSEKQRQRLAFPNRWLTVDKGESARLALLLQHGPDQWHCHMNAQPSARI